MKKVIYIPVYTLTRKRVVFISNGKTDVKFDGYEKKMYLEPRWRFDIPSSV